MSHVNRPTLDDVRSWPAAISVETACRALGLSRSYGYKLITRDEFPVKMIKAGSRVSVLTASLVRVLEGQEP